jgi:hypothetical protein
MNAKEKIAYVKNAIDEKVQISPKGSVYLRLYTLTEYEEGPILLSRGEQQSIIKKLEEDGYIKNVIFDDDGCSVWVELNEQPKEQKKNFSQSLLSSQKL